MVMVYRMPTEQKIMRFWQWFEQNQSEIFSLLKTEPQQANQKVNNRLKSLNRLVVAHLSMDENKNKGRFVLSADGIEALFPIVEEIMRYTPDLENWEFLSFIPPQQLEPDYPVDSDIRLKDLKFKLTETDDSKYTLDVYVLDLDHDKFYQMLSRVFQVVRLLLGEYKTVKFIDKININPLEGSQQLPPLYKLPEHLA